MPAQIKKQLVSIGILGIISLIGLIAVIVETNPFGGHPYVLPLFYLFLVLFCISLFIPVFYAMRFRAKLMLDYEKMRIAVREALLITVLIVGTLALSSQHMMYWWIESVFVAAILSVEIFFLI